MPLGPFYTNQVPRRPLTLIVRDHRTNEILDLSDYDSCSIKMVGPTGATVSTKDGQATILDPDGGVVRYEWPTEKSLFPRVGDYRLQVILESVQGHHDPTQPVTFEVHKAL